MSVVRSWAEVLLLIVNCFSHCEGFFRSMEFSIKLLTVNSGLSIIYIEGYAI